VHRHTYAAALRRRTVAQLRGCPAATLKQALACAASATQSVSPASSVPCSSRSAPRGDVARLGRSLDLHAVSQTPASRARRESL
jgi:hypothetical protein